MANLERSFPTCIIHYEGIEEELSRFTAGTYARLLQRRKEWISVKDEASETTSKTFDSIPGGLDLHSPVVQQFRFHYTCYKRFTDKSKLEKAQKRKVQKVRLKCQVPSPRKRRTTTRTSSRLAGLSPPIKRRNKDVQYALFARKIHSTLLTR